MIIKGALKDHGPYNKFLVLVGLVLFSGGLFTVIGGLLARAIFKTDVESLVSLNLNTITPEIVSALKLLQALMSVGTFILPPLMAAYLFSKQPSSYLSTDQPANVKACLLVIVLLFAGIPFINFMVNLNGKMQLPEMFRLVEEWMKKSEEKAALLTNAFFEDTSVANLVSNLVVIAVIPAIGEELLFRGVIQRLFIELTNKRTLSIVLTAVLFSALHMQFYGFLPRFMLGLAFGYLLEWSGSLWLPVLGHFINNAGAVIFTWLGAREALGFNPDTLGTGPSDTIILFTSLILVALILFYIRRISRANGLTTHNNS